MSKAVTSLRAHARRHDLAWPAAHEHLHRPAADRAILEVALLGTGGGVHVERERLAAGRAVDDDLLDHAKEYGTWPCGQARLKYF
jgi:hypothetical protein